MGLGFSLEQDRPCAQMSCVHSDNVIGDPSSLSDSRLKHNQQPVPVEKLKNIFAGIEAMEYDFQPPGATLDGQPLPAERRIGLIADDVKAAVSGEGWTNILGSKPVHNEDYLTLDYSRLVCVLWGAVKDLTARVAALEG